MITILYINNSGGGFAERIQIEEGTCVVAFFNRQNFQNDVHDYTIKVNRDYATRDYVLRDGDRLTITPKKVDSGSTFRNFPCIPY